jgi:hypothetical protein
VPHVIINVQSKHSEHTITAFMAGLPADPSPNENQTWQAAVTTISIFSNIFRADIILFGID